MSAGFCDLRRIPHILSSLLIKPPSPVMPHGWARPPCHSVHLPTSSIRERSCCLRLSWKEQMSPDRNIRCVLRDTGDYEAAEPRRPRLELESRLDLNLGISEFDRHAAAPAALTEGEEKEEEEGGYDRRLFSADNSFICEDEESKWWEQAIAAAFARQERLEAEVKQACSRLVSQASAIEGLKFRLGDRGKQILESLLVATMKDDDIERRRNEFMKRSERAATMGGDITSRVLLLHEADGLVNKQEHELELLWESVRRKEEEIEASLMLRKEKEGEVNAAESFLEERMREWLLALEELRQLVNKMSRWVIVSDEASLESFIMLKRLVLDVRTELIMSWRSVASSRQKLEDDVHKTVLFEREGEIKEEKESLALYTARLKEAQKKMESERIQLVVAEAQHEELKRELVAEQQLIEELQENLARDRVHLEQVAQDVSLLQAELDGRTEEYLETRELLRVKESELAEANLKIQHLDSERHAHWRILEDEDLRLLNTMKELRNAFLEVPDSRKRIDQKETTDLQIVQSKQNKPSDVLGQTVDLLPHGPEISKDKQEQDRHLVNHPSSGEIEAATTDLRKLTEACRQLLDRTHVVPDSSTLNVTESSDGSGRVIHKILTEITQLMALSEQLVAEAEFQ